MPGSQVKQPMIGPVLDAYFKIENVMAKDVVRQLNIGESSMSRLRSGRYTGTTAITAAKLSRWFFIDGAIRPVFSAYMKVTGGNLRSLSMETGVSEDSLSRLILLGESLSQEETAKVNWWLFGEDR